MQVSGFGSVNSYSYAYEKNANRINVSSDTDAGQKDHAVQTTPAAQTSQAGQVSQAEQALQAGQISQSSQTSQISQTSQPSQDSQISQTDEKNQSVQINETSLQGNSQQGNDINKAPRTADPQDFVFDFKQNNQYNLVAAKSKVEDVDVEKALSDMKKDSVLDQYKFFVKSSLVNNEDGTVRQVIRNR